MKKFLNQKTAVLLLLALAPVLQYAQVNGDLHSVLNLLKNFLIFIPLQTFSIFVVCIAIQSIFKKQTSRVVSVFCALWLCLMIAVPVRQNNLPKRGLMLGILQKIVRCISIFKMAKSLKLQKQLVSKIFNPYHI